MNQLDEATLKERRKIVVDEYQGIVPTYEAFYLQSIIYAADRSIEEFIRFDVALACKSGSVLIASSVQDALSHAAALSRFFWPSRSIGIARPRAAKLLDAFGLTDTSPLKNRELRNAIEHFDERLDEFQLDNDAGCFFPTPIVGDPVLTDDPMGHIFKLVDPVNSYVVILGKKYYFEPIRGEVQRILELASAMAQNGGRLRKHL